MRAVSLELCGPFPEPFYFGGMVSSFRRADEDEESWETAQTNVIASTAGTLRAIPAQ